MRLLLPDNSEGSPLNDVQATLVRTNTYLKQLFRGNLVKWNPQIMYKEIMSHKE